MAAAAARSGWRSGRRRRQHRCFLNTARSDGMDLSNGKEEMKESLQTVATMKPVRRGGGGYGSRTLRRSVRESATAAIGAQRTPTLTSRREPGRRRPLRRLPQCFGRGEAAGDCASTAAIFFDGFCRSRTARTRWVRELHQPRRFPSGPARRGASDKTTRPGMSSREDELKGESNESVAKGGIGLQTSAGRRRGEYTATRS